MSFPCETTISSADNSVEFRSRAGRSSAQMEARVVEGSSSNDQSHELQEGKKASTTLDGINIVDSFMLPENLPLDGLDIENVKYFSV
ncbi:hypothetical protein D8674_008177 [Pyrus ussuriensis x Pyrus communis]|uniref:Uncharacterized protein n=1 Tax=Pyrus ussuriensis x Pyrus communis TaxID=2448454 RepID=A0A5N5HSY4_9ROSA|nr:hypothetical protein D8674_008177 [Pyrus ussuriensis x Pyrus communis]